MSRHAGTWEVKHIIASVGTAVIVGGTVIIGGTVPAAFSHAGGPAAASTVASTVAGPAAAPTDVPGENNWG
jgi:hypothetical protein